MVIRSAHYDDVYFSAQDGFAESCYVFIEGCDLPDQWKDSAIFRVGETGFGTGLNFLALWKLFAQNRAQGQKLIFTSFEKHPLSPQQIHEALDGWRDSLGDYIDAMLQHYNITPQQNQVYEINDFITLDLRIGDVCDLMPDIHQEQDAWFLDGFAPSKNPDMWQEDILNHIGRLTVKNGRLSTFTAAGFVRRGLESAGFKMSKRAGFGRKREHLIGVRS